MPELTHRELQIAHMLSEGLTRKQIASLLGLSPHTVADHLSALYDKLHATNGPHAVRLLCDGGLLRRRVGV